MYCVPGNIPQKAIGTKQVVLTAYVLGIIRSSGN
jgi:hypothetical protein